MFAMVLGAFLYVFWTIASVIIPATAGGQVLTST
jgi:hypothetical protein